MGDTKAFKTAYSSAFGKRRGVRQAALRPSSPRRKNNPHPIQDFLIYNRLPDPPDTNIKKIITNTIVNRSQSGANHSTTLAAPESNNSARNSPHWIEWSSKIQASKIRPTLGLGPPRPHTTVGALVRSEFAKEVSEETNPSSCEVKRIMASRPASYVEEAIARSLSPRRHPGAPGMPGRSYTHYHGYRIPVSYIGALDLQAPNYNYSTGHQYPISNYTVYGPPPRETRPMHKHKPKRSSNDDYVHDHSVFTSTIPQVSGYYIIHPDWVSERASMRRSRSLMSMNVA